MWVPWLLLPCVHPVFTVTVTTTNHPIFIFYSVRNYYNKLSFLKNFPLSRKFDESLLIFSRVWAASERSRVGSQWWVLVWQVQTSGEGGREGRRGPVSHPLSLSLLSSNITWLSFTLASSQDRRESPTDKTACTTRSLSTRVDREAWEQCPVSGWLCLWYNQDAC